jgi:hypothetical protein
MIRCYICRSTLTHTHTHTHIYVHTHTHTHTHTLSLSLPQLSLAILPVLSPLPYRCRRRAGGPSSICLSGRHPSPRPRACGCKERRQPLCYGRRAMLFTFIRGEEEQLCTFPPGLLVCSSVDVIICGNGMQAWTPAFCGGGWGGTLILVKTRPTHHYKKKLIQCIKI